MQPDDPAAFELPLGDQFTVFLNQHRDMLLDCLDGLSEDEARMALVPSKTTLLGLVKHAAFAEGVWFGEAVTGQSRAELGLAEGPDESFDLDDGDTIESVRAAYRSAVEHSRQVGASLALDDVLTGNRRGPIPVGWMLLHMLRELAQHCGHAEILREQILATRA
ncbi:MAG: DinB family protein [Actinomycetota bacterium]